MTNNCDLCPNRSSCFNDLSINELKSISKNKVTILFKKGETMLKQNAFASHIYFIKKGLVKIFLEGKDKSLIIEIAGKGAMVGVTSLNYNKVYNFSVAAIKDVEACEINLEFLNNILRNNTAFASGIVNQLNGRIDMLLSKIQCLSHKNLNARMSETLLNFSQNIYMSDDFEIDLSRTELGEITNMATENVVRTLKGFENKGVISLNGKRIKILDYNKLISLNK